MADIKQNLTQHGLISVIRGGYSVEELLKIVEALRTGGVRCAEVTLNSAHALDGIPTLRKQFGNDLFIGAGTVRTAEDVRLAAEAGAEYLIAPCLDLDAVREARSRNILLIPGIFTATEAQAAFMAGCQTVKLFPANVLGPSYLKALRAPLDHIDFIPTGGVNPESIGAFHDAGAVAFGVGGGLVKNLPIDESELNAIRSRSETLVEALHEARAHG